MLCKVSNSTITGVTEKLQTKNADSTSITVNGNETTVVSSYSIADLKSYKFKADSFNMGGTATGYYLYVYFYINSTLAHTENFSLPYTGTLNNIETQTYTNSASGNTAIMIKAKNGIGRNGTLTNGVLEFTSKVDIVIHKKIFTFYCYPREFKNIGNKATCTLFGVHIDNTRLKDTPASYGEFVKFCNKLGNKQTITAPHNTTYTTNKYGILRGNYTSGTNVQVKINDLEIFNASLTSANQITIPPITIAPGDTVFVYGNGTNNCKIDLFG